MIDREMIDKDKTVHVAFVGNPNCGKTTLFNAITGSKLKVANWPGVTVEKMEGEAEYEGFHLTLVDTPGIYSLTCYTIEEKVTRQCVMDDDIEVIVNIVDASSLERNLYLTMQLLELGSGIEYDGYCRGAGNGDRPSPSAGTARGHSGSPCFCRQANRPGYPPSCGGSSL